LPPVTDADVRPDVEIGLSLDQLPEPSVHVDATVETSDWSNPIVPRPAAQAPFVFIDGVRRIDFRVMAEDGDRRAWGLIGSFGVGAVLADGQATWREAAVHRLIIIGGGLAVDPIEVTIGGERLVFEPLSVIGDDIAAPLHRLQAAMREAEGRLALELAGDGWVLADGPLVYPFGPEQPVVGVVKRLVANYLAGGPAALLPLLRPGQRTPIFALGHQVLDRYAWYQRLVEPREHWHQLAGLVRCELRMEVGMDRARGIADTLADQLCRFAGRPGVDPRAPQNLAPVGALEARLRHLLGNTTLVRRGIETAIARADRTPTASVEALA
jgi:uncharacterized protein